MTPTLQQRIELANSEKRLARVPFLTAGFPSLDRFMPLLHDLDDNGADVIEIGVPFSDPVADGPVVENASRRALENGVSLHWILEQLGAATKPIKAGLVLMGYYNPFYQFGLEAFAKAASAVNVQGVIVPDLPLAENEAMRKALNKEHMDLITLVGPNTSLERMKEYAKHASGYVYVVSVLGTTGVRSELPLEASATIQRAKEAFTLPVALGFGIKTPQQINAMQVKPDAAVFGSALLRHIDEGKPVSEFMAPWLA